EAFAVFGKFDRLDRRAQQLDAVAFQYAGLVQFHGEIETGLSAERRQERVGTFARDDLLYRCDRQRLEIDRIGDLRIGHDGRGIRVDEDGAMTLLTQGAARLNARVVELGSLTDNDRSRTDDHHVTAGHARAAVLARWSSDSYSRS